MKKIFSILSLMIAMPFAGFSQTYCTPTANSDDGYFRIYYVELSSGWQYTAWSTNYEYLSNILANTTVGTQLDFDMYPADYNSNDPTIENVFIDFNGDGDFDDTGEWLIQNEAGPNYDIFHVSVDIPLTATPGTSRIRLVMSKHPITSSCGDMGVYPKLFNRTTNPNDGH